MFTPLVSVEIISGFPKTIQKLHKIVLPRTPHPRQYSIDQQGCQTIVIIIKNTKDSVRAVQKIINKRSSYCSMYNKYSQRKFTLLTPMNFGAPIFP